MKWMIPFGFLLAGTAFPASAQVVASDVPPAGVRDAGGRREPPLVLAGRFYSAGMLVPESELDVVGRLVEVVDPTLIERSVAPAIQPYDRVLLVVMGNGVAIGERIQLLRSASVVSPWGRIFIPTGSGQVLDVEAGVATVEVDRFYDRVAIDDIAIPMPEFDAPAGVSPVSARGLEGRVVGFQSSEPLIATEDVAFVNLGATSGVVVGDEFEAYFPAGQEVWGRRPEVFVAKLQVLRVSLITSAVRVVSLGHPALQVGLPVRLAARKP
ncbi:MAG: hypothetical protein GEU90_00330 [Gemmatimonas sp.]|nr:hypothetical protein [Gemmatimonas sp.]